MDVARQRRARSRRLRTAARRASTSATSDDGWTQFVPFAQPAQRRLGRPEPALRRSHRRRPRRRADHRGRASSPGIRRWRAGLRRRRAHAPVRSTRATARASSSPTATQSIYLADMSGDGLTDLVRIRNGEVCYWPNLGYGRFGAQGDDGQRAVVRPRRTSSTSGASGSPTSTAAAPPTSSTSAATASRLFQPVSGNGWSDAAASCAFPARSTTSRSPGRRSARQRHRLPGLVVAAARRRAPADALRRSDGRHRSRTCWSRCGNNLGAETASSTRRRRSSICATRRAGTPWITQAAVPGALRREGHRHRPVAADRRSPRPTATTTATSTASSASSAASAASSRSTCEASTSSPRQSSTARTSPPTRRSTSRRSRPSPGSTPARRSIASASSRSSSANTFPTRYAATASRPTATSRSTTLPEPELERRQNLERRRMARGAARLQGHGAAAGGRTSSTSTRSQRSRRARAGAAVLGRAAQLPHPRAAAAGRQPARGLPGHRKRSLTYHYELDLGGTGAARARSAHRPHAEPSVRRLRQRRCSRSRSVYPRVAYACDADPRRSTPEQLALDPRGPERTAPRLHRDPLHRRAVRRTTGRQPPPAALPCEVRTYELTGIDACAPASATSRSRDLRAYQLEHDARHAGHEAGRLTLGYHQQPPDDDAAQAPGRARAHAVLQRTTCRAPLALGDTRPARPDLRALQARADRRRCSTPSSRARAAGRLRRRGARGARRAGARAGFLASGYQTRHATSSAPARQPRRA